MTGCISRLSLLTLTNYICPKVLLVYLTVSMADLLRSSITYSSIKLHHEVTHDVGTRISLFHLFLLLCAVASGDRAL